MPGNDADENRDWRPRPDPTILTTEALNREIAGLRRDFDLQLQLRRALTDEKLKTIDVELALIERQRVEQKQDSKAALDAALAAAKEAVDKNEKATAEQLKQQDAKFGAEISALRTNHDDLKERVAKIESLTLGASQKTSGLQSTAAAWIGVATFLLAIIVVAANILSR